MMKINYLFLVLQLVDLYGMEENKLGMELPILSKKDTIKNFLFDEFHKGLGVGLVGAGFFYGGIKMISYKSPFLKEIQKNKRLINALTLITAVLPTVKNFYAYRKFAIVEDLFLINQLHESYYVTPDPLKVLAMRMLKLRDGDRYDSIFALLEKLSFQAVKNMRNNMNEKALSQEEKAEMHNIFNSAIKEHFSLAIKNLELSGKVDQKDYDSIIKFFLLDINNIQENSEKIHGLIQLFKVENSGERFQYHPFEKAIIEMIQEKKKSFNREECFNLYFLLFSNRWNLISKSHFLFVLLTKFLSIDEDKRNSQLAKMETIMLAHKVGIEPIKDLLKKLILENKDYKNYLENLSEKISDENLINTQIFKAVLALKAKQSGVGEKIINFLFS
jgi:hypothetical protein